MVDTTDYLALKKKQFEEALLHIALPDEAPDDVKEKLAKEDVGRLGIRLKAIGKALDKLRPDKKQIDLEFDGKSPYEVLKEQFAKMDDGK